MINGKQRAYLRRLGNDIPAILQVGKGGITDNFIKQVNDALEAREIIKVNVLKNALIDARSICDEVADITGSEPVQVIGNKFILYKESKDNKSIELPN